MRASRSKRYALWSCLLALGAGLAITALSLVSPTARAGLGWTLLGWVLLAGVGVVGGVWVVSQHGAAGSGFIVAVGTSMLARLAVTAGGAAAVGLGRPGGLMPYLVGACVGFVPLQIFELGWFIRQSRRAHG